MNYDNYYKNGGMTKEESVSAIALRIGAKKEAVAKFVEKHKIDTNQLNSDLKSGEVYFMDVITAIVGKPDNKYEKEIVKKYGSKMAMGGRTQGYDDREDERLGMKYGKMSGKDFDGSHDMREHSRRDDARFEERMEKGGKLYTTQMNVGRAKYVINYHDGSKTHKDGSPFYDIDIFSNRKDFDKAVKKLESEGYKYRYADGGIMADGGEVYYVRDFYPNYDEDKIAGILKSIGAKKVRKAKLYGWSNQPDVVVFEGDKDKAQEVLEKEFPDNYISIYEKDWGRKMADGGETERKAEAIKTAVEIATMAYKNGVRAYDMDFEDFSERIFYISKTSYPIVDLRLAYNALLNSGYKNGGMMADGGYVIFEGQDHYNNKPLYQVISKDEDNDYVGEFHDNREDAEKELNELKNKNMHYDNGGMMANGGSVDGFSVGDRVIYKNGKYPFTIVELVDDENLPYANIKDYDGKIKKAYLSDLVKVKLMVAEEYVNTDLMNKMREDWSRKMADAGTMADGGEVGDKVQLLQGLKTENIFINFPEGEYEIKKIIKGNDIIPEGFYEIENQDGRRTQLKKSRFALVSSKGFMADGGMMTDERDKDGMLYALQEHVSSGEIASKTNASKYVDIDQIRSKAIQYYVENGDKPYSYAELESVLKKFDHTTMADGGILYGDWDMKNGEVTYQGKLVTRYDFDRDADAFFIDAVSGGGQKGFREKMDVYKYLSENMNLSKFAKGGMLTKSNLESIKNKYEENEDENYHGENIILLAENFGNAEDLSEAKRIFNLHKKEGHLSSQNGKMRQDLHLKLIGKARAEMKKEGIQFAKGGKISRNKNKNDFKGMFDFFLENNDQPIGKRDLINMAYESSNGIDSAIPQSMVGDVDNTAFFVYDYQTDKMGELVDLRMKLKFSNVKVDVTIVQDGELKYGNDLPEELENATFHQALNYVFTHDDIEQFSIRPRKKYAKGGMMADGGAIENQYEGRTAEDIWNNLTERQRMHFLVDHRRSIIGNDPKEPYYENSNKNWNDLDFEVSQGFVGHVIGGQYAKGGMMADGSAIKGSNPSTGERFGVVIGSLEKEDGITFLTIRSMYSSRISSYELRFDEKGFLWNIADFGNTTDGTFPDMKKGNRSVRMVNADNKKESIDAIAKITSPSFAKKVYEYVHEEKMAKGDKLKVNGDDFSFLLDLSDNQLSKRLDLINKQKTINYNQYLEAKKKGESTEKIEASANNLENQYTAIIQARIRISDDKQKEISKYSKQTTDDFTLGEIVYDVDNKRYGTVIGIYDEYASDKFELRLDSDGMQPTENLRKVGSKGDKGTKEQLNDAITSYARLVKEYPNEGYPKQIKPDDSKDDDKPKNKWEYTDKDEIEYVVVKNKFGEELKFDGKDVISGVHDLLEKGGKLTEIGKYYSKNNVVSVFVNGKNILDKNTVSGVWIKKDAEPNKDKFNKDEFNEGIVTDLYENVNGKKIRTQNQRSIKEAIESANENSKYYKGYSEVYIGANYVGSSKNGVFTYSSKYKGTKYDEGGMMADGGDVTEMKIGKTTIRKGANGWVAKTFVDNFKGFDWEITTIKNYKGDLTTTAQGGKSEDRGGYQSFSFAIFGDPSIRLKTSRPPRVTDKIVSEQHNEAMKDWKERQDEISEMVDQIQAKKKMAEGGAIGFDALAKKVADNYEGDNVKKEFQNEYGKKYDKKEAEEVGKKVAGKVYRQQQAKGKMAKGGKVDKKTGTNLNRSQSKMTLISRKASEIRKANEPWRDAFNRAKAMLYS
jgi:hypothetical protein